MDLPFKAWDVIDLLLNHVWVCIDQCEDTLRSGKPRLDLCPKRGEIQNGKEELIETDDEQIPRTNAHQSIRCAQPANIYQYADKNTADRIQHGKYQRKNKTALY